MHDVRIPAYNCAFARGDIGVPTCELVDANVAVCAISVSRSRLNFTSVIVKSVASNLRRRSVFRSLCLTRFHLMSGTPRFWTRDTDSGRKVECAFCPACGSRLWHQSSGTSETVSVKAGSLDEPVDISNAVHIWTSRKPPSVVIPEDARQFTEEPD